MDAGFITIVQKLVAEQGKNALIDPAKCKAFLSGNDRFIEETAATKAIDLFAFVLRGDRNKSILSKEK
jgi:hypothetical protein